MLYRLLLYLLVITVTSNTMQLSNTTLYTSMVHYFHKEQIIECPDYTPESLAIINHGINPYAVEIKDVSQFLALRTQLYPDLDFTLLQPYVRTLFSRALLAKKYPDFSLPHHIIDDIKRQGSKITYDRLKNHDFKKLCEYLDYGQTYQESLDYAQSLWNSYTLPLQCALLALMEKKYKRPTLPLVGISSLVLLYSTAAMIQIMQALELSPHFFGLMLFFEKMFCLVLAYYLFTPDTECKNMRNAVHVWLLLLTPLLHVEELNKRIFNNVPRRNLYLGKLITHFKKKLIEAYI